MIYPSHVISAFDDLSITLDFPSSNLTFPLVRGSPYLTFSVSNQTSIISLSTIHAILSFSSNQDHTKHTIKLNNDQTWLVYTSSQIHLTNHNLSVITSSGLSGIVRVAVLPDPESEAALDQFSSRYPFSGEAVFGDGFNLEYKWEAKGSGDLLMLAHPLHVNLLKNDDNVAFLEGVNC
ncbi:putative endo-1,3(4)-beta-glucanase [Rosa chinensis]|uniref:Putative endo-1,3(4)-beta-glucanase n=1 Tax=Rosa chinensis TaxID=74649 RepID=A0A2P6SK82_ROSCH|nr:putative endo-1,3(4)-beta-glucanase [Rosa chinensis]